MIVGTPKEIKNHEYRVGLTPESVCNGRATDKAVADALGYDYAPAARTPA